MWTGTIALPWQKLNKMAGLKMAELKGNSPSDKGHLKG